MPQQHRIIFVGLWCLLVIVMALAAFTFVLLFVYSVVLAFWYVGVVFNLTEALCWLALDRRKSSDMPKKASQEKRPKKASLPHALPGEPIGTLPSATNIKGTIICSARAPFAHVSQAHNLQRGFSYAFQI